jgi:hypothetical protein
MQRQWTPWHLMDISTPEETDRSPFDRRLGIIRRICHPVRHVSIDQIQCLSVECIPCKRIWTVLMSKARLKATQPKMQQIRIELLKIIKQDQHWRNLLESETFRQFVGMEYLSEFFRFSRSGFINRHSSQDFKTLVKIFDVLNTNTATAFLLLMYLAGTKIREEFLNDYLHSPIWETILNHTKLLGIDVAVRPSFWPSGFEPIKSDRVVFITTDTFKKCPQTLQNSLIQHAVMENLSDNWCSELSLHCSLFVFVYRELDIGVLETLLNRSSPDGEEGVDFHAFCFCGHDPVGYVLDLIMERPAPFCKEKMKLIRDRHLGIHTYYEQLPKVLYNVFSALYNMNLRHVAKILSEYVLPTTLNHYTKEKDDRPIQCKNN